MSELAVFLMMVIGGLALLFLHRRREGRRLHQKVKETLRPQLREELERERREAESKRRKFAEAMKKAGAENKTG